MGTRAQIDVRQGNKVVRVYSQFDGFPRNVLPALRAAASAGCSTPFRIAQALIRELGGDDSNDTVRIIDEDRSDYVSYHFAVDVSSKPWRVSQTTAACLDLPTLPNGGLDYSAEALKSAPTIPAVTSSFLLKKKAA